MEITPKKSSPFFYNSQDLENIDPELFAIITHEERRQQESINLIASENYVSPAVLQATGSVLTNKYAEGYPGKRYYSGCQFVDQAEGVAIERCKQLFNAEHANVQPHSGSQANMAVYTALLKPGDTILGMSLAEGGHLTHGHTVNFSGGFYRSVQYGVNKENEQLDYAEIAHLARNYKPKLIIAGASAYSRFIDFEQFARIAQEVGAYFMADIAHIAGLVAAGLHPHPFPHADVVTSTTHKTLRGPRGGLIMCKAQHATAIDKAIMPGTQGGPFMHTIAAKAVAFKLALEPSFKAYQQHILDTARAMAAHLSDAGYRIVADGTDNHMFVIDLRSHGITGKDAALALEQAAIIVSKSCIPHDPEKPWITSGIRIGTPALATRNITISDAQLIASLIDDVIKHHADQAFIEKVKKHILEICNKYPIFKE